MSIESARSRIRRTCTFTSPLQWPVNVVSQAVLAVACLLFSWNARALESPAFGEVSSRWTLSSETAYLFQPSQNPFFFLAGRTGDENNTNPNGYELATQIVGGRYRISETGGWRFLRGHWQFALQLVYSNILQGPETYYGGFVTGFRYNFVPSTLRVRPYVEFRGGLGLTDASHTFFGQQRDLSFTYLLGTGISYEVDPRWKLSLGVLDQHLSNAYMADVNYGFDALGVNLGFDWRFR